MKSFKIKRNYLQKSMLKEPKIEAKIQQHIIEEKQ